MLSTSFQLFSLSPMAICSNNSTKWKSSVAIRFKVSRWNREKIKIIWLKTITFLYIGHQENAQIFRSQTVFAFAHRHVTKLQGRMASHQRSSKSAKNNTLVNHLHELLCQCWDEGTIPQDMRDANIVTLYKNKGDRRDCNNYRGISLLSIVGKAFARVLMKRLQLLADHIYPESQCGFRAKRSTVDMIFSLRQLQEKCRDNHCSLPLSTWPKLLTLLTGVASLHYFKELDTLLNSSKWSGPFTTTCKAQSSTMAHHLIPSQSTVG